MSDHHVQDELPLDKNAALTLFVGDSIGSGASRRVYEVKHDPTLVLKVEYVGKMFHNVAEWAVWREVKDWPISDWFVPCVAIDSYGSTMLQKRSEVFTCRNDFHDALRRTRGGVIPSCLDDIHYGNFGIYDGRVACHDYAYHNFVSNTAREMSIEAGYISFDPGHEPPKTYDIAKTGGQFALNI